MPPGAFSSIVSNGPIKAQRRPRPLLMVASISFGLTTPSCTRRKASVSSATCKRLSTKPSISRMTSIGTCPTPSITSRARALVASLVQAEPQGSTTGAKCGGFTG